MWRSYLYALATQLAQGVRWIVHSVSTVKLVVILVCQQTGSLEDLPLGDTLAIAWIQDCISSSVSPWIMTQEFKLIAEMLGAVLEISISLQGSRPFQILQGRGILKSKVLKGEHEALGSLFQALGSSGAKSRSKRKNVGELRQGGAISFLASVPPHFSLTRLFFHLSPTTESLEQVRGRGEFFQKQNQSCVSYLEWHHLTLITLHHVLFLSQHFSWKNPSTIIFFSYTPFLFRAAELLQKKNNDKNLKGGFLLLMKLKYLWNAAGNARSQKSANQLLHVSKILGPKTWLCHITERVKMCVEREKGDGPESPTQALLKSILIKQNGDLPE